jgi:hypothetical protein
MGLYLRENKAIPLNRYDLIYSQLNDHALAVCLPDTINFLKSKIKVPTIFLVCRDFRFIQASLMNRYFKDDGTVNDLYNAEQANYQVAQYYVYTWMAKVLKAPIFDVCDFKMEGYNVSEMHVLLADKFDIPIKLEEPAEDVPPKQLPDLEPVIELQNELELINNDSLFFEYSKK